jgi:hypothetical protein
VRNHGDNLDFRKRYEYRPGLNFFALNQTLPMTHKLSPDEILNLLKLEPQRDLRFRAADLREQTISRRGCFALAVRRGASLGLGALFHGGA